MEGAECDDERAAAVTWGALRRCLDEEGKSKVAPGVQATVLDRLAALKNLGIVAHRGGGDSRGAGITARHHALPQEPAQEMRKACQTSRQDIAISLAGPHPSIVYVPGTTHQAGKGEVPTMGSTDPFAALGQA